MACRRAVCLHYIVEFLTYVYIIFALFLFSERNPSSGNKESSAFFGNNIETVRWCQRPQSTYIPRVPLCLSLRPNWDYPTPSPASECVTPPPPPEPKEEGNTLACGWRGGGEGRSQFGRLEKKPSTLSTLCARQQNTAASILRNQH